VFYHGKHIQNGAIECRLLVMAPLLNLGYDREEKWEEGRRGGGEEGKLGRL
jgi:hypothetical protein